MHADFDVGHEDEAALPIFHRFGGKHLPDAPREGKPWEINDQTAGANEGGFGRWGGRRKARGETQTRFTRINCPASDDCSAIALIAL